MAVKIYVIGNLMKGFRFYGPVEDEDEEPTGVLEQDDDWFVADVEELADE
jgi:hypothetical protein